MTAIKQERATVRWKTNRTVSVPGRPANADTYNCESFDATVVFMDGKVAGYRSPTRGCSN
jgi:hypothetical protein